MSVNEEEAAYRSARREKARARADRFMLRELDDVLAEYGEHSYNRQLEKLADKFDAIDAEEAKDNAEDARFEAMTDKEAYEELRAAKQAFDKVCLRVKNKRLTVEFSASRSGFDFSVIRKIG